MKKLLAILISLLMVPMVFGAKDCTDDDVICDSGAVTQQAEISGTGTPPTVEFAWVLPDEDSYTSGTQAYPALSDERDLYACIVVSDPQGRNQIENVYTDVFHPSGTGCVLPCVTEDGQVCDESGEGQPWEKTGDLFKYQAHATRINAVDDAFTSAERAEIEECKGAALDAGLITPEQYDDIDYYIFDQWEWYMYKVQLPMLYHQPSGTYITKSWATDDDSEVSQTLQADFDWVSTVAIEIDFWNGLNYGVISPSTYKVIQGDYNMEDYGVKPTIKNEGNELTGLSVSSTTLVGQAHAKEINDFDVKWDPEELGYGHGQYYYGPEVVQLLPDPLELCQTEKIDFSVHADVGLPEDIYTGTLTLNAYAFEYTCD